MRQEAFRLLRDNVRHLTVRVFRKSDGYEGFEQHVDEVLLLGDRVLAACQAHPLVDGVSHVTTALEELAAALAGRNIDVFKAAKNLLQELERWLKVLIFLLRPSDFHAKNKDFNLFKSIELLDLLSAEQNSLPFEAVDAIANPVSKRIRIAREDRNTAATHDTVLVGQEDHFRFLTTTLITFLAPLYKHRVALRESLTGLIVRPLALGELEVLVNTVSSERQRHLSHFGGRDGLLALMLERLRPEPGQPGRYILITGEEGAGKSAICSKLTAALAPPCAEPTGSDVTQVNRLAPWLPGAIVHYGKQSRDLCEILSFMVAQANTMLLEPITPAWGELSRNVPRYDLDLVGASDVHERVTFAKRAPVFSSDDGRLGGDDSASFEFEPVLNDLGGAHSAPAAMAYRRCLYETLERLVRERGHAYALIDALDEISPDGTTLDFLPDVLPAGATVVLSVRSGTAAEAWVKRCRRVDAVHVTPLTRQEIPLITGVDDDAPVGRRFNDEVYESSKGWALVVSAASRRVRETGAFEEIDIADGIQGTLKRMAADWHGPAADVLELLRDLLAVFEPVQSLDFNTIQGYLAHVGHRVRGSQLRQHLDRVGSQLDGFEAGRVKLGIKPFADYIRNQYLTVRDLRAELESITEWLSSDPDVGVKTIGRFIRVWANPTNIPGQDVPCRQIVESLITTLAEQEKLAYIHEVGVELFEEVKAARRSGSSAITADQVTHLAALAERSLRQAAERGYLESKRHLGVLLLNGRHLSRDVEGGERLLRDAASAGCPKSMVVLAGYLIEGGVVKHDAVEAERWLRAAVEAGDPVAARQFGYLLLTGGGATRDVREGLRLLERAVAEGDAKAHTLLATVLLQGDGVEVDRERGERLLKEAVGQHSAEAMVFYGDILLDGVVLERDAEQGLRLLRRAVEMGSDSAVRNLGKRLLLGDGVPADAEEAERLLRKGWQEGSFACLNLLVRAMLDGLGRPRDEEAGRRLLDEGIASGDLWFKASLGRRLMDGDGLPCNGVRGEALLREAIDAGQPFAMAILGARLINEDSKETYPGEGEGLLRRALELGHAPAAIPLAQALFKETIVPRFPDEARSILERAAESGVDIAMRILGASMVSGRGMDCNPEAGLVWLKRAAARGEAAAMSMLGEFFVEGEHVEVNADEGLRWLRLAAGKGEGRAMWRLASILRKDDATREEGERWLQSAVVAKYHPALIDAAMLGLQGDDVDKREQAEAWLREAVDLGDVHAAVVMGQFLLDGPLPIDPVQGEALLRRSIDGGSISAAVVLAEHLFTGEVLQPDPVRAEAILRPFAEGGDLRAMRILGRSLIVCRGPGAREKGLAWLARAAELGGALEWHLYAVALLDESAPGAAAEARAWLERAVENGHVPAMLQLGYFYYRRNEHAAALRYFLLAVEYGETSSNIESVQNAANNAAYMIRRGEVPHIDSLPRLVTLLGPLVSARHGFGIVNMVLTVACGVQCPRNWTTADQMMWMLAGNDKLSGVVEWWTGLAKKGEGEGHLVLGWLVRKGMIDDPDGLSLGERMALAEGGGWAVPDWMKQPEIR